MNREALEDYMVISTLLLLLIAVVAGLITFSMSNHRTAARQNAACAAAGTTHQRVILHGGLGSSSRWETCQDASGRITQVFAKTGGHPPFGKDKCAPRGGVLYHHIQGKTTVWACLEDGKLTPN